MTNFVNEPLLELRRRPAREQLIAALAALDARLPLDVPVIVDGDRRTGAGLESRDPANPDRVVARAALASDADVDAAVAAGERARAVWGSRPAAERAAVLSRAAGVMRRRRHELAALAVRECAKPWPEADADVCEAIDFLEFYAREAEALERRPGPVQLPGERNDLRYVPRGIVAVIAPWNFPIAIATGMTAAALATGNAALLKPAEQSPACALALVDALLEAGVPPAAVALLPGEGDVGAALVRHPGVHTIAFTGSGDVGLEIMRTAADVVPGQRHLKRVIAELGGKNCVIVDADADLDDAVPAIVASAFGFAGQKCSAAARVIAHERIAAALEERLAGAISVLRVGAAEDFATDVPPVIDAAAQARVQSFRGLALEQGRLVAEPAAPPERGRYCRPALVADLPSDSAVLHTEIFGPVLALERARDIEEACDRMESLPFALTGGLFSRNPRVIERVRERAPVGNLYVNRGTTGAMVARQPFGGNRMSGTGTKAGGTDYLLSFVEPRVVTENTLRHGLVV